MSRHDPLDVSNRVPRRVADVETLEQDGAVALRRLKRGPAGTRFLRLFGVDPMLTIRLDDLGAAVWHGVDGTRTTGRILLMLAERFPEQEQLPQRLGVYLSTLARNRLIEWVESPGAP